NYRGPDFHELCFFARTNLNRNIRSALDVIHWFDISLGPAREFIRGLYCSVRPAHELIRGLSIHGLNYRGPDFHELCFFARTNLNRNIRSALDVIHWFDISLGPAREFNRGLYCSVRPAHELIRGLNIPGLHFH
ncbi:MAG: hypothetical protein K1X85_12690, partial [Ignavibacteria bacterium]|nr:hypothetical protein [Ignavibacteria bacterium]